MSGTLIAIIILTAIFGGYIIDYQKNKLKWQSKNTESSKDLDELKVEMDRMRKRIENLEAIVTDVSSASYNDFTIDEKPGYTDKNRMNFESKASQKLKNKGN